MYKVFFFSLLLFTSLSSLAQLNNRFDVVISEIMADPTPQVGLPNNEWIELKNTTTMPINLAGARLLDAAGTSGAFPNFMLQPDSSVIVCTASAVAAMSVFGTTISITSFPSLDNTGEILTLRNAVGKTIHSIAYTDAMYGNELKKDGGWTLEMIDAKNPCNILNNYKASVDLRGGTPGKSNSIAANNPDIVAPKLSHAYTTDNTTIVLVFNEPLDSTSASVIAAYTLSGLSTASAQALAPSFDKVIVKTTQPMAVNTIYNMVASNVKDCAGNTIGLSNNARVGISSVAQTNDVVINEVLFNPKPNGNDYVEIYNRSNIVIDLKQLFIANRNSTNTISNIKAMSADNFLLFPQDFMVLTENIGLVLNNYVAQNINAFTIVPSMPSYNDDKSNVVVLNAQGNVVDELAYDEKWHFSLLRDVEGVALERINPNAPTQQAGNWHSAATSVGYGTPTYKNSQMGNSSGPQGEVSLSQKIISPDGDGFEDFVNINYAFAQSGYAATITIYDAAGRLINNLQRNAICGTQGSFKWDGLGNKSQALNSGVYIILTEVFALDGSKKQFKQTITLARKK